MNDAVFFDGGITWLGLIICAVVIGIAWYNNEQTLKAERDRTKRQLEDYGKNNSH